MRFLHIFPMWLVIGLFFFVGLSTPDLLEASPEESGCLNCHEGIEDIGLPHDGLTCTDCHRGDEEAAVKDTAHEGMFPNPGDLRVVDNTCGECHEDHVTKVKKSIHATMAGIISGARYTWAAQKGKNALYSVMTVKDEDGDVPAEKGALKSLEQIPTYSQSSQPIDDYLRGQCLRCHLWTEGKKRDGDYRSSGCSACHVLYDDDGLSRSGDPTIPKDEKDHPVRHEITVKIPSQQCIHCHNRGGRTGVSFIGTMESDGYGTPFQADGSKQGKLHGKYYNHLQKDVHYERGMECIDCHTSQDLHGDGNIYSKKEQAVEIECTDCHGTLEEFSELKTSWGNRIDNLRRVNNKVVLTSKTDGEDHPVTQLRNLKDRGRLPLAMQIKGHMEHLECYACHARWAPQCYGCHAKMDVRKRGFDWVSGKKDATFGWEESRSYLRWETPILGVNPRGKVSTFVPGCQAIFTQIGEDGQAVVLNKVFTTSDGYSGLAHNPIQPHTVSGESRTCDDCHASRKALGLGGGYYISEYNGLGIEFELERIVDEEGRQIQATSHVGARPFNKEEMERINRSGVCLSCHRETEADFWKNIQEKFGVARTNELHKKIIERIFKRTAIRQSQGGR